MASGGNGRSHHKQAHPFNTHVHRLISLTHNIRQPCYHPSPFTANDFSQPHSLSITTAFSHAISFAYAGFRV
ncbi:MAG: hypothetical protein M5U34_47640 [Chloroflexi bacterium]|nr:hypothetical protein [Chloroflexota bacterium]